MERNHAQQAQRLVANQTWMRADAQTQAYLAGQIAAELDKAYQTGREDQAAESLEAQLKRVTM